MTVYDEHAENGSEVNLDRALSVDAAINAFAIEREIDGEDPDTIIGDMIGNLLHWLERQDPSGVKASLRAASNGIGAYMQERVVPNDMGPDALVSVQVECAGQNWSVSRSTGVTVEGEVNLYPSGFGHS